MSHKSHHRNRRRKNALINLERQQDAMLKRHEHLCHAGETEQAAKLSVKLDRNIAEQDVVHARIVRGA